MGKPRNRCRRNSLHPQGRRLIEPLRFHGHASNGRFIFITVMINEVLLKEKDWFPK